ncbi:hypothetical protein A1O3_00346 [Capronia epimyces CBS 606.96]|uniref:Uncharacterized protein n=1 Tax=Capronia epimyces CBS 606.96 TaxID=1182542 RepID=W9YRA2_9EURO|nr:uncharacterized protein A1O3_00346 [Capronia epimyces CBS 606.96]EXJ91796.1 hypothetical protein A1O3_00346 [Capronia epimyces CBS 606.96]
MPLAITQAAAYINQRTPRVTISTYLEALKKSDDERGKLLQKDIRDPRRDGKASNSIMATWYISFEHIRRDRDSAARLLALMSLFDREGIPDYLLHDNYREDGERLDDFEEDIAMLRKFHLVDIGRDNIGRDNRLFDMHRLVQFSTKKWLEQHHELERWQCRYIEVLSEAFPTGKYGSWQTCQALFPHVEIMAGYQVEDEKSRQHFASVLDRGVWYGSETGRYGVAEKMARMSLQVREEGLGRDHIRSLNSVGNLARVLQEQGRYDEAEELNRRALAGCEKTLAMDHPNTLMSMENLAVVLQRQGKFDQAEELNRRALAEMEKVLGMDHPNTLNSVSNLAYILDLRQERDKALELYGRAVNGFMKVLGPAHPKTLDCQRNRSSLISRMSTS